LQRGEKKSSCKEKKKNVMDVGTLSYAGQGGETKRSGRRGGEEMS